MQLNHCPEKKSGSPKLSPREPRWLSFHTALAKYRSLNAAPTTKCCSAQAQVTGHKLGGHFSEAGVKSKAFCRNISPEATSALNKSAGLLLLTLRHRKCQTFQRVDPVTFRCFKGYLKYCHKYMESPCSSCHFQMRVVG